MNKQHVLFHLKEALEELERTIADVETDDDYGEGDFVVAISHLYHHVNTAWNARDASPEAAAECSQADFDRWRQFPTAEEVMLDP